MKIISHSINVKEREMMTISYSFKATEQYLNKKPTKLVGFNLLSKY